MSTTPKRTKGLLYSNRPVPRNAHSEYLINKTRCGCKMSIFCADGVFATEQTRPRSITNSNRPSLRLHWSNKSNLLKNWRRMIFLHAASSSELWYNYITLSECQLSLAETHNPRWYWSHKLENVFNRSWHEIDHYSLLGAMSRGCDKNTHRPLTCHPQGSICL